MKKAAWYWLAVGSILLLVTLFSFGYVWFSLFFPMRVLAEVEIPAICLSLLGRIAEFCRKLQGILRCCLQVVNVSPILIAIGFYSLIVGFSMLVYSWSKKAKT